MSKTNSRPMTPPSRTAAPPRTDTSGQYELLLKSYCPFCAATVYLARPARAAASDKLITLHEEKGGDGPCEPFRGALTGDPHGVVRAVMAIAPEGELDSFFARTRKDLN